ncbi:portal protein [Mycobacterium phage Renaud18]|uniref:Portal protein n=1 Tax=Mycobacterium phage Renaud18 TaxID=2301701 RepID=A0A385DZU0_9CAUD|nr:portal protein [Mycobacterium phage Renaud18]AXQ64914.1 portal protein [Mycobacterium phage Renaud18]UCR74379.1 portal protein [Mycobacterium phage Saroj]UZV39529.1 portal protein [Mycobacterium phage Ritam007]
MTISVDSPVVAVALPTLQLNETQDAQVSALRFKLQRYIRQNQEKSDLYEGKRSAEDLGISAPEKLPELINAVIGWPGTVVDVLEERLEFRGWTGADNLGLDEVARDNQLGVEAGRGHLDALIYGCGFITVGRGDTSKGEPDVLVTVESTESCTVEWDYRLRRAKSALSQTRDELGRVVMETLYLPNETIMFEDVNGQLKVTWRDVHNLGRVPVARLLNRERASDVHGRSEITRPVVYLTDAAIRTLCGMEINREFYTSPKWTALNADPEVFGMSENNTAAENKQAGWKATAGRMNAVPPQVDDQGNPVEVKLHEFRPAPPTPYIEQVRAYSQLLAAESGIPAPYLGFVTDNPSSADSIRQQEYRLVKRAERRQTSFGLAWLEVARLSLMIRDRNIPQDVFRQIGVSWRDAATPTRAAAADEAAKLIGSGVLPPDSSVTWDRIGLSQQEQQQLQIDRRRSAVNALVEQLRNNVSGTGGTPTPAEPTEPTGAQ